SSGRLQISFKEGAERRGTATEDRTGSPDKDQDIQGGMKRKTKKCSDQDKADASGMSQISVQEGVERRSTSIEDRTSEGP
ncbi:hypothetical protein P5673_021457, partial [Acropora cervicornis]